MNGNKKKYYLFKMNTGMLNGISIILLILSLIIFYLIYLWKDLVITKNIMMLVMILMIPYFIFHEILHSISYSLNGADFKNITYGMHLEKGVLCCLCKQNISKQNILRSLLFPFLWIGIFTLIIGLLINGTTLIILSFLNISGCSGDLLMFKALSKINNFEYSEYDNPISFGIYTKEDLSSRKFLGLDYVGITDSLERKDLKKVTVSKHSIIFFIIYILIIILDYYIL